MAAVIGISKIRPKNSCLFLARSRDKDELRDVKIYIKIGCSIYHSSFSTAYLEGDREMRSDGRSFFLPQKYPFKLYEISDEHYDDIMHKNKSEDSMIQYRKILRATRQSPVAEVTESEDFIELSI